MIYILMVLESVQCSVFSVQLLWRREAPSKYNASTTDLGGSLIKTIDKTLYEMRLLSRG